MGQLVPLYVFCSAFLISALGGFAGLLRSAQAVNTRTVLAATLYSGLMGLIIALLWYNHFEGLGNVYFLLGIAGLTGIGGVSFVDLIIKVAKRGGLHITISPAEDDGTGVQPRKGKDQRSGKR
jgi:hypothetical protein